MRGFLLLLAGAVTMALTAHAGQCTPEGLRETSVVIKPAMLGCAIDAHVYGGEGFHCSSGCAEDLDRSLLTSDAVFDCVDGIFNGAVTSATHPDLDAGLAAFVKQGPNLIKQCNLDSARTKADLSKEELADLAEMQEKRTAALEELQSHMQAHEQARDAQRTAELASLQEKKLQLEENSATAAASLAELHKVHAAQLTNQAALATAHTTTETSHAVLNAVLPHEEEKPASLLQAAAGRLRGLKA